MSAPPNERTPGEVGTSSRALEEVDEASVAKVFAHWQARFALQGFTLRSLPDGRFSVGRWNLEKVLHFAEVESFAQQVGA
jgi:hypothetical protein